MNKPSVQPPDYAGRFRSLWSRLTRWAPSAPGESARVDMGRCPIRPAIRPLADVVEAEPTDDRDRARARLQEMVRTWPTSSPRLAIEGGTGLGKTHAAVERCVDHAVGELGVRGIVLFVAHTVGRVSEVLARIREEVAAAGDDPSTVRDLLGRQGVDAGLGQSWEATRFGCMEVAQKNRSGRRGRQVKAEVCKPCQFSAECELRGYLAHTEEAFCARVLVTTVARLTSIPDKLWDSVGAVICDEDVMPGLLQEFWGFESDIRRAARYILRRVERAEAERAEHVRPTGRRTEALRGVLPLLTCILEVLGKFRGKEPRALVSLLPDECEVYGTAEGVQAIRDAVPLRCWQDPTGQTRWAQDELAPAPWERRRKGWTPRQIWGRFLRALVSDLLVGDTDRAATVRVVPVTQRGQRARLHILRFDERTIRRLRGRPLLLLDATLHPAITEVLDVRHERIQYRQRRSVVQALTSLHELTALRERAGGGWQLTARGRKAVAQVAAWCAGRIGFVLCRKSMKPLLEAEAKRYYELRRVLFITPRRERGWDAPEGTAAMVVLGRYAKNGSACLREAHALRSVYLQLTGSTKGLDDLEQPRRAQPFVGRGKPLLYMGEPVERITREPEDRLAALLQTADRAASVRQFIGRDRVGTVHVLLLRGDPTIPVDALVEEKDLAEAMPADGRAGVLLHDVEVS